MGFSRLQLSWGIDAKGAKDGYGGSREGRHWTWTQTPTTGRGRGRGSRAQSVGNLAKRVAATGQSRL